MRSINQEGLTHIRQWEGLRLSAYKDVAGVWTIGFGHTAAAGPPSPTAGMRITESEAVEILRLDLKQFEEAVETAVKVPLNDNQFAALVSFCFNVGAGAFRKSTLLKKLNAGDYNAVPSELAKWNKAGGKTVQGLVNRRAAEAGLWAKGSFVSSNTVDAKPAAPATLTPENIAAATSVLTGVGAVASGSGPVQWALGAVLVVAAAAFLFLFLRSRLSPR
jgi:lysozyme